MIEVTWDGRTLKAQGHSPADARVCSAMSGLAGTLFTGYGAPQPTDGHLIWDSSSVVGGDVPEFVLNFIRTLVRQYPGSISLSEVQQSAA